MGKGVTTVRCWLESKSGSRIRVDDAGVRLGRGAENDVILRDHSASRAHALVRFAAGEAELLSVGRNPALLNRRPVMRRAALSAGDRIELPGESLVVRLEDGEREPRRRWALEETSGLLVGLGAPPLWIGGGPRDTLLLPGLPPHAALLHVVGDDLILDARTEASVDGEAVVAGEVHALAPNVRIELGGHVLLVRAEGAATEPTLDRTPAEALPTEARFSFMPAGGLLELRFGSEWLSVELSELRGRLVATLLKPPGEHEPGDFVPDEVVIPLIWPGDVSKARADLNTLVHRVRRSLLAEGLNPTALLQRLRAGGATRFRLSEDAPAVVQ